MVRGLCNTTRGIEAGRAVIRHRGVSDSSDGACHLCWSHSARMEIFFANVQMNSFVLCQSRGRWHNPMQVNMISGEGI
jgi:hypothetical protein